MKKGYRISSVSLDEWVVITKGLWQDFATELPEVEGCIASPDIRALEDMERMGMLECLVALDQSHKLIGYATIVMSRALHHDNKVGLINLIYVAPSCRKSGVGSALLKGAKVIAKQAGCLTLTVAEKGIAKYSKTLIDNGFNPLETIHKVVL